MKKAFVFLLMMMPMFGIQSQTVLKADGAGNTYELITEVLAPGYNPLETPDCSHLDFGRHIDEVWDTDLSEYVFRFYMHVVPDNDRCINTDRQRNEIKVYVKSPDELKSFTGDIVEYKWKFKIDKLFQPSTSFTHLHQLKFVGGSEDKMPLITLTARKANPDKIELRYARNDSQITLATFDLSLIAGEWVTVDEIVKFGEQGTYEIRIIKISDSTGIFHYQNKNLRMWRSGALFSRPKWGIYRSLNHAEQLRDEVVLFNEFSIDKLSASSTGEMKLKHGIIVFPNPAGENVYFDFKETKGYYFFRVINKEGKTVLKSNDRKAKAIDISQLAKGLYLLEFVNNNKRIVRKLIKM